MNKKLIIANWKNHPDSLAEAEQILDFTDDYLGSVNEKEFSLVFCPPTVFLEEVSKVLKTSHLEHESSLGAQDVSLEDGEQIFGPALKRLGVEYVIVGHSDRRWRLGESGEVVNKKLKTVLANEMTPIVCIGEKTQDDGFRDFLKQQISETFSELSADDLGKCIIAYEPVWAISTNLDARPDTPENALESIRTIKEAISTNYQQPREAEQWPLRPLPTTRYLYGGSVTSKNVTDFIGQKEIDGVLIGGASVNKEEFVKILSLVK